MERTSAAAPRALSRRSTVVASALAALVVAASAVACSSEEAAPTTSSSAATSTSTSTTSSVEASSVEGRPTIEQVERTLRAYVAAINDGDVQAALALRCSDLAIASDDRELFALQAGQLVSSTGPLEVVDVEAADANGTPVARYAFAGFEGRSEVYAELGDDGEVELCGWRPVASYAVAAQYEPAPDLGPTSTPVRDLLPIELPGLDPVELRQVHELTDPDSHYGGFSELWSTAFADPTYGGVRIEAIRFPDAVAAERAVAAELDDRVWDAVTALDIDERASSGVRSLSLAWLWAQPPAVPPYADAVAVRFADTIVVTAASAMDPDRQVELLRTTVADVIARAGVA